MEERFVIFERCYKAAVSAVRKEQTLYSENVCAHGAWGGGWGRCAPSLAQVCDLLSSHEKDSDMRSRQEAVRYLGLPLSCTGATSSIRTDTLRTTNGFTVMVNIQTKDANICSLKCPSCGRNWTRLPYMTNSHRGDQTEGCFLYSLQQHQPRWGEPFLPRPAEQPVVNATLNRRTNANVFARIPSTHAI